MTSYAYIRVQDGKTALSYATENNHEKVKALLQLSTEEFEASDYGRPESVFERGAFEWAGQKRRERAERENAVDSASACTC